jgi:hypothetical protein
MLLHHLDEAVAPLARVWRVPGAKMISARAKAEKVNARGGRKGLVETRLK